MVLKDKKVLVTGSGGFIGSHLVERLVEEGCNVKAFVRYNSKNFLGWLEESKYKNDIEVYTGDIRDYDSVKRAMEGIEVVFHLAADTVTSIMQIQKKGIILNELNNPDLSGKGELYP